MVIFLQNFLNEQNQVYTLKTFDPMGQQTSLALPAWFFPGDKYSRGQTTIKKRFKMFMTQQPHPVL
ncbi:H/ACA ribonucleoprotein complex subunit 3-like [Marmota marmota marmota]|uniref:Nucleolar protein 10 n=1 Tax=Marmota marmota marmota TaxID=9994 RepID=A0A8C5YYX5_MARMA|nr:H/ACA ribonucleoprotein complex subunit 3-like [Marmota marmota marmota]